MKTATEILHENGIDIMSLNDEFNTSLLKAMEEYASEAIRQKEEEQQVDHASMDNYHRSKIWIEDQQIKKQQLEKINWCERQLAAKDTQLSSIKESWEKDVDNLEAKLKEKDEEIKELQDDLKIATSKDPERENIRRCLPLRTWKA